MPFFIALVTGIFAIAAAITAVLLKRYLGETRPTEAWSHDQSVNPFASPTVSDMVEPSVETAGQREAARSGVWRMVFPMVVAGGGTLTGFTTRAMRPYVEFHNVHTEALLALCILCGASITLVVRNRREVGVVGHVLLYLEMAALWGGYLCGWALVHRGVVEGLIPASIIGCLVGCVLGSLVLALIQWRDRRVSAKESPSP